MGRLKTFAATALTANDTTSKEELGQIRVESDGKGYRYVQVANLTALKGDVCVFRTSNNYSVTVSHTLARRNGFAGVATATIAKSNYGWVQCSGYNTYLHTTGGASAGDSLVVASASNRLVRKQSNTANLASIGRTLKDDSGSILTACILGPT